MTKLNIKIWVSAEHIEVLKQFLYDNSKAKNIESKLEYPMARSQDSNQIATELGRVLIGVGGISTIALIVKFLSNTLIEFVKITKVDIFIKKDGKEISIKNCSKKDLEKLINEIKDL